MNTINRWALTLLAGCLLIAAWPVSTLTGLIFFAWMPLLALAASPIKKMTFFWHILIAMLCWNTGTTWWIWNSTDVGTIAAITANSLLMCIPWLGYRTFLKKYGKRIGYCALLFFWMSFEYIHLNWQISWPWLNLGNVFSLHPNWVQWYEFTGIGGGTLLIVATNIFLYEFVLKIRKPAAERKLTKPLIALTSLALFVIGFAMYYQSRPKTANEQTMQVVVVQPNINPYAKFTADSMAAQIKRLVSISKEQVDSNTQLLVWPETALSARDWQDNTRSNPLYQPVFELLTQFPKLSLLSGIEMFVPYGAEKTTPSAHSDGRGGYYDVMNAAMMANARTTPQYYYKSKLVPGVETLPDFLQVMAPLFEQFGGTSGGYGKSATSAVLPTAEGGGQVAPIICYESIYGEYVGTYVKKGANLLAIITNDGWWGNTPGHKQHLNFARLRAIETRKWIVRSANTGISAIINDRGEIVDTRPWDTMAAIKFSVPLNKQSTLYVTLGDFLYKLTLNLAILTLCWHLWHWLKQRRQKK